jgi:RNA polymerase sigma-70 factor (ECF subfamily)
VTDPTDLELVKRVQKGDKRAFDLLVGKYQHKVISLVTRYVRDHDEALDISQDTFVKAYKALPNFRGESAFYTWLYRIAINTAKNYLVARSRRPPDSDVAIEDAEYFTDNSRMQDMDTPEHRLLRDEMENVIHQAIKDLPEDLRTAVTLREFDGLSYEDIADIMHCPVGTVRSRIFRAREAIDKKLQPLLD